MKCTEYNIGQQVKDVWFGTIETLEVIGHDCKTNQVQIKHLSTGGNGSYYVSPERLEAVSNCDNAKEFKGKKFLNYE